MQVSCWSSRRTDGGHHRTRGLMCLTDSGRREGTTQVLLLPRRDLAALEMTQDGETYENSASVWETDQIPVTARGPIMLESRSGTRV